MNDLEQKDLLQTETLVSDELSIEDLEEVDGGALAGLIGGAMIGAGAAMLGGVISGKPTREILGDAAEGAFMGGFAGAFLPV